MHGGRRLIKKAAGLHAAYICVWLAAHAINVFLLFSISPIFSSSSLSFSLSLASFLFSREITATTPSSYFPPGCRCCCCFCCCCFGWDGSDKLLFLTRVFSSFMLVRASRVCTTCSGCLDLAWVIDWIRWVSRRWVNAVRTYTLRKSVRVCLCHRRVGVRENLWYTCPGSSPVVSCFLASWARKRGKKRKKKKREKKS